MTPSLVAGCLPIEAGASANLPDSERRFYYATISVERMRKRLAAVPADWTGAQRERAEEIIAVWDRYEAETEATMRAAGYSEDEEEEEAICDHMAGLTRDVAHTPATTLPGLIFKAMAAAFVSDPAGDTLLGRAEQAFADGYEMSDAGVGRGIIRDLLRLASTA